MKEGSLVLMFQGGKYKVLDDTSRSGNLARRRLQYSGDKDVFMKRELAKLNKPIFRYSDIFQFLSKYRYFIDFNGKIFNYELSKFVPLVYYKIKRFVEIPTGYYIEVHGVHTRFFLNRIPLLEEKWVGLLEIGLGYAIYELTDTYKLPTRRKI